MKFKSANIYVQQIKLLTSEAIKLFPYIAVGHPVYPGGGVEHDVTTHIFLRNLTELNIADGTVNIVVVTQTNQINAMKSLHI